jgi:16S rRNA (guanine966-N2)-methyltransferase
MRMGENGAHGNTRPGDTPMNGPRPQARGAGVGSVRIIGGRWRGTRLPVADSPGLRPSSDRVRETLFNWLQPALPGARVLDLFAGTGVLGLEAVSRGAASAQLIEADHGLSRALQAAVGRLGAKAEVAVHQGDALAWLRGQPGRFDIAFVDPPFAAGLWEPVLAALPAVLAADAWLYVESPSDHAPMLSPEWGLHREGRTRDVRYALYRRVTLAAIDSSSDPQTT